GSIGCQIQGGVVGTSGLATITKIGQDLGSFIIPGGSLQQGQTYQWRVRCGCSQNPVIVGPWSDFAQFTTAAATIEIAPNPTEGLTQVSFVTPSKDQVLFEVIDMSGRLVETLYQGGVEADQNMIYRFDGSDLPNGVYLIRLSSSSNVITEKLMIAR
ncbi:MAG: T9SS type A sorting domain-containing protein, partial [Bacteroidota bacterium]